MKNGKLIKLASGIALLIAISLYLPISVHSISRYPDLDVNKVNIDSIKGAIKELISDRKARNGYYIIGTGSGVKEYYLFLNESNVLNDEKPLFFEDVKIENNDDTIIISIKEGQSDYKNKLPETKSNMALYKVKQNRDFEYIKVYKNGIETNFSNIGFY